MDDVIEDRCGHTRFSPGGRVDNFHVIVGAQSHGEDCLVLDFDAGETLQVWNPAGVTASATEFIILDATRVRWEWYFYGREQAAENLYFIEHARVGNDVVVRTDFDWASDKFSASPHRPAVELLGM